MKLGEKVWVLALCVSLGGCADRAQNAGPPPTTDAAIEEREGADAAGTPGTAEGGASEPTPGSNATPWTAPLPAYSVLRKVKGALTGLAPTDAEGAALERDPAALSVLLDGWMATAEFEQKMLLFFGNAFQQTSLSVLDFEFQLRKRPGAFDLAYDIFGDDAYPSLFKNLKESFARTCLAFIAEGRPFTEVLTTQRFMMTTALKSLYMQIEMPYDIHTMSFGFDHGRRPSLEATLDPASPDYLVFGYAAPSKVSGRKFDGTCAGDASKLSRYPGNTLLFQVLLGSVPRDSTNNSLGLTQLGCMEHAAQPYFAPSDFSDWEMVAISGDGTPLLAYDLPALRRATELSSKLPRVGFFTTPAFLAVWNTNDSNQHRVTVNQALLVALGQGFTSLSSAILLPPTASAIDGEHAVATSSCYGCHKSLDPMREFFGNFYDFQDRADGKKSRGKASFGFGDVAADGTTLLDFGRLLGEVVDRREGLPTLHRFALELTQKLCFFANSQACEESDAEMRRVALAFEQSNYDFKVLVRELFSSPLVTGASLTETARVDGVVVSVAHRDQLCAALEKRLNRPDLCENALPAPTNVTSKLARLAGALPADGFSRGSEYPVTAPDPSLFYFAASELVCESVAEKVVDAATAAVYSSADPASAIEDMVTTLMGVPPSEPKHAAAVRALTAHYQAAVEQGKVTPTNALRSTFAAACQAPSTLSLGI